MDLNLELGIRDYDPQDDSCATDIPARYRAFREGCPVGRSEEHGGFWVITSYDACVAVARDTGTFSSRVGTIPDTWGGIVIPPILMDPPEHQKYRKLVQDWFTPQTIARLEPRIRERARETLEGLAGQGELDLSVDYARHVAFGTIAEMMGISPAEERTIVDAFEAMTDSVDNEQASLEGMGALLNIFSALLVRHREHLGGDVESRDIVSHLLTAEIDGAPLPEMQLVIMCFLLVAAGFDTTQKTLSATLHHLAEHPDLRRQLAEDPGRIGPALDELVRYFAGVTPVRVANSDATLEGCPVKADDLLIMLYPSANRDDAHFANADDIDLDRSPNRHIAFGVGPHRCLGMHLARMEMRVALEELLAVMPEFEIRPEAPPIYRHKNGIWGVVSLPVVRRSARVRA